MKKRVPLFLALLAGALAALAWYVYGSHRAPDGQPPLVELSSSNFATIEEQFDATRDRVRVVALLSPT